MILNPGAASAGDLRGLQAVTKMSQFDLKYFSAKKDSKRANKKQKDISYMFYYKW